MTKEHKDALARGRQEAASVRAYLSAMGVEKRRGRKVSPATMKTRISELKTRIASESNPERRLTLIQSRHDLEDRLAASSEQADLPALEKAFVSALKSYSERRGIGYAAWRELGVSAPLLKKAGVPRTRRASDAS